MYFVVCTNLFSSFTPVISWSSPFLPISFAWASVSNYIYTGNRNQLPDPKMHATSQYPTFFLGWMATVVKTVFSSVHYSCTLKTMSHFAQFRLVIIIHAKNILIALQHSAGVICFEKNNLFLRSRWRTSRSYVTKNKKKHYYIEIIMMLCSSSEKMKKGENIFL